MSGPVLVLNCGSSSVKYRLVQPASGESLADGVIERVDDYPKALQEVFDAVSAAGVSVDEVAAVGHRVVHGGRRFYRPTLIGDELVAELEELAPLAPLHNPPGLLGINAARKLLPDVSHVAVFDTAFFHDLPAAAAEYAIDREVADKWHIRRYGFHGTSHQYVSEQAAQFLGLPLESVNQIVLHLGNGASASAIAGGRPIDTSMGLTPMEGLVMGTRSGDVDPGIIMYLSRAAGMSIEDIDVLLNRHSGVSGLGGATDFRELHKRMDAGDDAAQLAYDVYIHRLRKYIGGYLALLGGADVITFTAGVGENDAAVRRDALAGLLALGIEVDEERNLAPDRGARRISIDTSPVSVLVIPTNEELAIARACVDVCKVV